MSPRTHYEVLGLAPSASTPVIKASYRALVLIHHPDKTLGMSPQERAYHSSAFRDVQEAYDTLSDLKLKAKYDAEIHRHNGIDIERSTFHAYSASPRSTPPKSARRPPVKVTTPEEKRAIRAKIEQQMAQIQEDRERRDAEEASMSINDLKFTLKMWKDLADEHRDLPIQHASILIKIYEYEQKIRDRELQQEDWLNNLAKPKGSTPEASPSNVPPINTPAPKTTARADTPKPTTARPRTSLHTPKPTSRMQPQAEQLQRDEDRWSPADIRLQGKARMEAAKQAHADIRLQGKARMEAAKQAHANMRLQGKARMLQGKARMEAAKQAHADAKAAAVRAEKKKQAHMAEEAARKEAERIARVRAKVAPAAPKVAPASSSKDSGNANRSRTKKTRANCGKSHTFLVDWKKYYSSTGKESAGDENFFVTV